MPNTGHDGAVSLQASRRRFLSLSAAGAAAVGVSALSSRRANADILDTVSKLLELDPIVLNYAFEMEELQADFFGRVSRSPVYDQLEGRERGVFNLVANQDRAHYELLNSVRVRQGARQRGNFNEPNGLALKQERRFVYPAGAFTKRESLMKTAVDLKESCVAAYHGAVHLVGDASILTPAVAIAGVDGRHLAVLREIAGLDPIPTSFENQISPQIIGKRLAKYNFNGGASLGGTR